MKFFKVGIYKDRKLSSSLTEKVMLSNWFAGAVFVAFSVYAVIYFYLWQPFLAIVMIAGLILTTCVLLLNHIGFFVVSRCLMLSICNIAILIADVSFKFAVGVEAYYFPACLAAFLMFSFFERRWILTFLLIPLLFWSLPRVFHLENLDLHGIGWSNPLTEQHQQFLNLQNYFGALLITIYFSYTFFRSLEEYQKSIINANKLTALGEMSAGIAHEINNPLTIIVGKSSAIKRRIGKGELSPETILADLDRIDATVDRISKIIKGLKNFSRSDEQEPHQVVDPHIIVDEVLGLCQDRLKSRGIRIEVVKNAYCLINCRQYQIAQVLMNLLNNAADAINGQNDPWIQIEARRQRDQVEISVIDSGLGIPQAIVNKMMEPFFTTKEAGKGTGLGLSISKGIMEAHCGELVYDDKSKHTRFIISIPVGSLETIPLTEPVKQSFTSSGHTPVKAREGSGG